MGRRPLSAEPEAPCPPEHDPDPARPAAVADGAAALPWRRLATGPHGHVNFWEMFYANHISVYALTYVQSPDERTATLLIGGDDQVRVWFNGRPIHETTKPNDGPWALDPVPVTLRAGRNTILVKVSQDTSGALPGPPVRR